ncbi:signal peptidase I [Bengtsoniella intestinalis]|uniref:signal peptidase I n=1 Tax=Bengtsoniella intestinalis TaxID=3073143 RepID=UPI00391FA8FD
MNVLLAMFKGLAYAVYGVILLCLLIGAPMLLGYHSAMVISGSMEPNYPVGSITYYKQTAFENIQEGDVITFDLGETSLATHRVVAVNAADQTFTTKGDANETQDVNPVAYSKVEGKTIGFAIPYAGYFVTYVKSMTVIIPCAAILIIDLLLTPKDKKKDENPVPQ